MPKKSPVIVHLIRQYNSQKQEYQGCDIMANALRQTG